MKNLIVLLLDSFLLFSSCNKDGCSADAVKAKFVDLTGLDRCGIVIELTDGSRLEPTNLSDFGVSTAEGTKIWVEYHETDGASICMTGKLVKIDCVSER